MNSDKVNNTPTAEGEGGGAAAASSSSSTSPSAPSGLVPLLVAPAKKKLSSKKPRIRPNKKGSAGSKRKASKIGSGSGGSANPTGATKDGTKKLKSTETNGVKAGIVSPSPPSQTSNIEKDSITNNEKGDESSGVDAVAPSENTLEEANKETNDNSLNAANDANDTNNTTQNEANSKKANDENDSNPKSGQRKKDTPSTSSTKPKPKPTTSSKKVIRPGSLKTSSTSKVIRRPGVRIRPKGIAKPIRPTSIRTKIGIPIASSLQKQSQARRKNAAATITTDPEPETDRASHKMSENDKADTSSQLVPIDKPSGNHKKNTSQSKTKQNEKGDDTSAIATAVQEQEDIIPYQHLGQLDPSWKIPPPKENEKTMKDFCSRYVLPAKSRKKKKGKTDDDDDDDADTATTSGDKIPTNKQTRRNKNSNNIPSSSSSTTASTSNNNEQEGQSGPLVEVINGEIVIKESTMIVGQRKTTEEVDREMGNTVVEEDNTLNATYLSYKPREKQMRWTVEETRNFYLALRQCGTDFSTMMSFFDGSSEDRRKRSRKQLKSKYKIECKKNLKLIDRAMNPKVQLPMDLSVFGELDMNNLTTSNSSIVHEVNEDSNNDPSSTSSTSNTTNVDDTTTSPLDASKTVEESVITEDEDPIATAPSPPPPPLTALDRLNALIQEEEEAENQANANEDDLEGGMREEVRTNSTEEKTTTATSITPPSPPKEELTAHIPLTIVKGTKKKKKQKFRVKPRPGAKGKKKK